MGKKEAVENKEKGAPGNSCTAIIDRTASTAVYIS